MKKQSVYVRYRSYVIGVLLTVNVTVLSAQSSTTTIENTRLDSLLFTCLECKEELRGERKIIENYRSMVHNQAQQIDLSRAVMQNQAANVKDLQELVDSLNKNIKQQHKENKKKKFWSFVKGTATGIGLSAAAFVVLQQ